MFAIFPQMLGFHADVTYVTWSSSAGKMMYLYDPFRQHLSAFFHVAWFFVFLATFQHMRGQDFLMLRIQIYIYIYTHYIIVGALKSQEQQYIFEEDV